jgi:hypothetical protein
MRSPATAGSVLTEAREEWEQAERHVEAGLKNAAQSKEERRLAAGVVTEKLLVPVREDAAGRRRAALPLCGSSAHELRRAVQCMSKPRGQY